MIQVKNVTKKYGDFYAVKNISFEIAEGEIVGFLGQNGAGKTTTMNMITGFIEPTEGEIIVNGNSIDKKPKKVKKDIGYMPEGVPLYSDLTVKEFVSYMADLKLVPGKQKKDAVEKVIRETNLEDVQNKLTRNLSRGYKQRVSLAGALVGDPKILILDEPTVGLDPKQVAEIRELIKSLGKKHTVLLSSHILTEVSQICEKVIIINKGEILAIDTPSNLESKVSSENIIRITVEDEKDEFVNIKDEIKSIKEITLMKENVDKTKTYRVVCENDEARKEIFSSCAKREIIIVEIKKQDTSLEDAFLKIISNEKMKSNLEKEEKNDNVNKEQNLEENVSPETDNESKLNSSENLEAESEDVNSKNVNNEVEESKAKLEIENKQDENSKSLKKENKKDKSKGGKK